jgi:hypothetical protein
MKLKGFFLETSDHFYICLCLKDKGYMNCLPVYLNATGNINCKCFNDRGMRKVYVWMVLRCEMFLDEW